MRHLRHLHVTCCALINSREMERRAREKKTKGYSGNRLRPTGNGDALPIIIWSTRKSRPVSNYPTGCHPRRDFRWIFRNYAHTVVGTEISQGGGGGAGVSWGLEKRVEWLGRLLVRRSIHLLPQISCDLIIPPLETHHLFCILPLLST